MATSFNTTATFFCLQGGRCREVQLYLTGFETEDRHGVLQVFILELMSDLYKISCSIVAKNPGGYETLHTVHKKRVGGTQTNLQGR